MMFNFDAILCINLDRRQDRMREFCARWDEQRLPDLLGRVPERFAAIDGQKCAAPTWWKQGGGAWGCYRSHLAVIEMALNAGWQSVLIFEDDAVPVHSNTAERIRAYMESLPTDWGMAYLGGQHLDKSTLMRVNDQVIKPVNVNRTHAYALRMPFMLTAYKYLCGQHNQHIDFQYGNLCAQRVHPVYAPVDWIFGQAAGKSDIARRTVPARSWDLQSVTRGRKSDEIIAVIGLHRSGSSCVAGMLAALGCNFGKRFVGCEPDGGFEDARLAKICERCLPFPGTRLRLNKHAVIDQFAAYLNDRQRDECAAIKYPILCALAPYLAERWKFRIVHCARPLEKSIASLIRRAPNRDAEKLRAHQEFLHDAKLKFLASYPAAATIDYDDLTGAALVRGSDGALRGAAALGVALGIYPGTVEAADRVRAAAGYVRPELRHVA